MKTTTSERASVISVIAYCITQKKSPSHMHSTRALSFLYSPSDMTETQQALNILRPYGM